MISTIGSIDELDRILGPHFIILAGSAISSENLPRLPSVDGFRIQILQTLQKLAKRDAYRERVGSWYARRLVTGPYAALRKGTKFEQFLEDLLHVTSRDAVNELLAETFTCAEAHYGPNHAAIAELLRCGACSWCLTTNFDNAIERAIGARNAVNLITGQPPSRDELTRIAPGTTVYKLHGDAGRRTCDFTASDLLAKAQAGFYERLAALLEHQTVLVVGYSGRGDIDIAGHLRRARAHYVWAYYDAKEMLPWDDFEGYRIRMDLSDAPAAARLNHLVALAARRGDPARVAAGTGARHEWTDEVGNWADRHRPSPADFVSEIFGWRRPVPALHLLYIGDRTAPDFALRAAGLLNAAGSYFYALSVCLSRLSRNALPHDQRVAFMRYVGFAFWRLWLRRLSRHVLQATLRLALRDISGRLLADMCRLYLEVCRDILQDVGSVRRRLARSASWQLRDAIEGLQRSSSESPENDILSRLVVYEVNDLLGQCCPLDTFQQLFNEAVASSYQRTAWAAATAIAMRDADDGVEKLQLLERQELHDTAMRHYIWKCRLSRLEARVAQWFGVLRRPITAVVRAALGRGVPGSVLRSAGRDLWMVGCRIVWAVTALVRR